MHFLKTINPTARFNSDRLFAQSVQLVELKGPVDVGKDELLGLVVVTVHRVNLAAVSV